MDSTLPAGVPSCPHPSSIRGAHWARPGSTGTAALAAHHYVHVAGFTAPCRQPGCSLAVSLRLHYEALALSCGVCTDPPAGSGFTSTQCQAPTRTGCRPFGHGWVDAWRVWVWCALSGWPAASMWGSDDRRQASRVLGEGPAPATAPAPRGGRVEVLLDLGREVHVPSPPELCGYDAPG